MKSLIALLLFALPLFAQPKPIEVTVQRVNDRRAKGFFSELAISLELPKVRSSEISASRVLVSTAVDDQGNDLVDPQKAPTELEPNFRGSMMRESGEDPPATISVALKNPARSATTVTDVRGEIELYMPGRDPNSIAEITKFAPATGKPLTHKALKANGVEITLLTPAQIEAEKKRLTVEKRKSLKTEGWEDGENLESYLTDFESSLSFDPESDTPVRIKDPNKRIQSMTYIDGNGEEKRANPRDNYGMTVLTAWGGPPKADWKLKVEMKTAKNVVRHTFALKDVKLP